MNKLNRFSGDFSISQQEEVQTPEKLESKYCLLKEKIKCFDDFILSTLKEVQLSHKEEKRSASIEKKVQELCNRLEKTYKKEWKLVDWHGFGSFQRIVWQDERFLQLMQDPLAFKILLKRDFKVVGFDLKKLALFGLAHNRFSYLMTVAPNWCLAPEKMQGKLQKMDVGKKNYKAEPLNRESSSYMISFSKVLISIENVLENEFLPTPKPDDSYVEWIAQASVKEMIAVFKRLIVDKDKISKLTEGSNKSSTQLQEMVWQCFEVMNHFDLLCKEEQKSVVLNYGIFSHALDGRHLAAVLYWIINDKKIPSTYKKGKQSVEELLKDEHLLKVRLQQVLQLIIDNGGKLGLSKNTILQAFKEVKQGKPSEQMMEHILSLNFIEEKKIKVQRCKEKEDKLVLQIGKLDVELHFNEKEMVVLWGEKKQSFPYGKKCINAFISLKNQLLYEQSLKQRKDEPFTWKNRSLPATDTEWIESYAYKDTWTLQEQLIYPNTKVGTYGFCYSEEKQRPYCLFLVRGQEGILPLEYRLKKSKENKWIEVKTNNSYDSLTDFVGSLKGAAVFLIGKEELFIEKESIDKTIKLPSYHWGTRKMRPKHINIDQLSAKKLLKLSGCGMHASATDFLRAAERLRKKENPNLSVLHQLYKKAADGFWKTKEYDQAFQVRALAAYYCDPKNKGILYNMRTVVQEGQKKQLNSNFIVHFTGLGSGELKEGVLKASCRQIDGKEKIQIEFKLSHPVRIALQETLIEIQANSNLFLSCLPKELKTKIYISFVGDCFLQRQKESDKPKPTEIQFQENNPNFFQCFSTGLEGMLSFEDLFSKPNKECFFTPKYTPKGAKAIEIEFEGIGKVVIGNSLKYGCLYNNVKVFLDAEDEGIAQTRAHQMLTMLGMGPIFSSRTKEEDERLKIALIFRTYFPREAILMERTQEFYELSLEDLLLKIVTAAPGMSAILKKYKDNPELIQKIETETGKTSWALMDIGQQMREKGAYGLMAGVGKESQQITDSIHHVLRILKYGLWCSQYRFQSGLIIEGLSSELDLSSGGGSYGFGRLVNEHNHDQKIQEYPIDGLWKCVGHFQILYDLDCLNTGGYAYHKDTYGCKSPYGNEKDYACYEGREDLISMAQRVTRGDNEVMVKEMIFVRHIRGIVCQNEEYRKLLIEKLDNKGLIRNGMILGKSVNEFIYVSDTFRKEMWDQPKQDQI